MQRTAHDSHYGISLLEILISIFIFSMTLLGLETVQLTALQQCQSNFFRTIALQQIQSMRDRIFADPNNIAEETNLWNAENKILLPDGQGNVTGKGIFFIELSWFDPSLHHLQKFNMEVIL